MKWLIFAALIGIIASSSRHILLGLQIVLLALCGAVFPYFIYAGFRRRGFYGLALAVCGLLGSWAFWGLAIYTGYGWLGLR